MSAEEEKKMSSADRVMQMQATGSISKTEANELLGALGEIKHTSWKDWLVNPMRRMTDGRAFVLIAIVTAAQIALGLTLPIRFDGALDMHAVKAPSAIALVLREWLVSLPLLALVFFGAARVFGSKMRPLDAFTVTALGRVSTLVMAVIAGLALAPLEQGGAQINAVMIAASLALLPLLVFEFVWMFHGFKTAANIKGGTLWAAFLLAIVVAEVISKLALVIST